jgi:hypothetical protein
MLGMMTVFINSGGLKGRMTTAALLRLVDMQYVYYIITERRDVAGRLLQYYKCARQLTDAKITLMSVMADVIVARNGVGSV